jgi:hypothetical protein
LLRRACAKLRFETTGEGACETFDGEKPKQAQGQTKGIAETDDMTSGKLKPLHTAKETQNDRAEPQINATKTKSNREGIAKRNEADAFGIVVVN